MSDLLKDGRQRMGVIHGQSIYLSRYFSNKKGVNMQILKISVMHPDGYIHYPEPGLRLGNVLHPGIFESDVISKPA
jgi:hypothetical protein